MTDRNEISCQDALDISAVATWWQNAVNLLTSQTQSPVCIKAASIQRIDAAGLQALLMFVNSARQKRIEILWDEPSDALRLAARLSGLEASLQIEQI